MGDVGIRFGFMSWITVTRVTAEARYGDTEGGWTNKWIRSEDGRNPVIVLVMTDLSQSVRQSLPPRLFFSIIARNNTTDRQTCGSKDVCSNNRSSSSSFACSLL